MLYVWISVIHQKCCSIWGYKTLVFLCICQKGPFGICEGIQDQAYIHACVPMYYVPPQSIIIFHQLPSHFNHHYQQKQQYAIQSRSHPAVLIPVQFWWGQHQHEFTWKQDIFLSWVGSLKFVEWQWYCGRCWCCMMQLARFYYYVIIINFAIFLSFIHA